MTDTSPGMGPGDEGIADLGREIASDAVRLVRAEVNLAKAELAQTVRGVRSAIILFAAAAGLLLFMLVAVLGVLADGVGTRVLGAAWKGWAVLAGVFLVVAAALGYRGYRVIKRSIADTKDAVGSLKEDAAWLRLLTRREKRES